LPRRRGPGAVPRTHPRRSEGGGVRTKTRTGPQRGSHTAGRAQRGGQRTVHAPAGIRCRDRPKRGGEEKIGTRQGHQGNASPPRGDRTTNGSRQGGETTATACYWAATARRPLRRVARPRFPGKQDDLRAAGDISAEPMTGRGPEAVPGGGVPPPEAEPPGPRLTRGPGAAPGCQPREASARERRSGARAPRLWPLASRRRSPFGGSLPRSRGPGAAPRTHPRRSEGVGVRTKMRTGPQRGSHECAIR
jgi:hypothetical protein